MLMTDFLHKVDQLAVSMNKEQLVGFIHNEARILNENDRKDFLTRLSEFADSAKKPKDNESEQAFDLSSLYKKLDLIKIGEAVLTSECNEEYDDWYNDEEEPYIYHDTEHIADTVLSACQMIHALTDWEKYDDAVQLAETLLELSIEVESEYEDEETFYLGDLFDHELISADYEKIVLDMLYAAYMALPLPKRAETIYCFIESSECRGINLEKLMQHSDRELPHIPEFLDCWTEFLCNQSGSLTERLLRESVAMTEDNEKLVHYAEKYGAVHPCIYDVILEKNPFADTKEAVQVGMRALEIIPAHYTIRSNIALMTAKYALTSNDTEKAEHCWLEAFRSYPTETNLLRLMTMYGNFSEIEQEVRAMISAHGTNKQKSAYVPEKANELSSYNLSNEDTYRLLFLLGDYMDVLKKGMKAQKTLGWSYTFLKCGIPLFFLLMYNNTRLNGAMLKMCTTASEYMSFRAEDYCRGTQQSENNDTLLFWDLFRQTRCSEKLPDEEQQKIMERLTALTELRTNLIVSEQKRGYYNECASYIAALGEVLESHGQNGSKQALLSAYKSKYPRHSAFIRELKNYGLK